MLSRVVDGVTISSDWPMMFDMSAANPVKSAAAPRTAWSGLLCDSAIQVFAMMAGATVTRAEDVHPPAQVSVTGVVGIGGILRAIFSMRCSALSATKMASQMLSVPIAEAESQRSDALGELCNIIAGDFKARIGLAEKCMLSVPTIITGGDYRIHSLMADERLELTLLYDGEPIWIALEIRK